MDFEALNSVEKKSYVYIRELALGAEFQIFA